MVALLYPNLNYMSKKNCSKKTCTMENPQPLENFHKNKRTKDGLSFMCKACKKTYEDEYRSTHKEDIKVRSKIQRDKNPGYNKKWRKKNPEKFKTIQKKYKDSNREEIRKQGLEYYYENRERQLELGKKRRDNDLEKEHLRCKQYRQENRGILNAKGARRRATQLQATPKWLTVKDNDKMKETYKEAAKITKETGIPHHVDHIWPLQGENVCGLHVPWNLRVLIGTENSAKNNKILEKDLEDHRAFVMSLVNKKDL